MGPVVAPEKVQHYQPWQYLGYVLFHRTVRPQIVPIQIPDPLTLNSLQQLLGTINWIRLSSGITTGKLTNFFNTLKGDPDLNSPRSLSNQARQELDLVNQYLSSRQLTRVNRQLPVRLFCFPTLGTPTSLICPDCQALAKAPPTLGIDPRGLRPRMIWQTDVTHYQPFGRLKYLHISVDTHSGALHATPLTRKSAKNIRAHCLKAFSHLGCPQEIKTDNGPGYIA